MYTEEKILCLLKSNKKKVGVYFNSKEGVFSLRVKPNVKLDKSKYNKGYRISSNEKKFFEFLRLNPDVVRLEYTKNDFYILISKSSGKDMKLPKGMMYKQSIGFFDNKCTLKFLKEY